MKKIGIIINTRRPHAEDVLRELGREAERRGFELYVEQASCAEALRARDVIEAGQFGDMVDVVLALGGDGTVLYAARALHGSTVPIMGINLGSLGFLTSVGDQQVTDALEALETRNYKISSRSVAACRIFCDQTFAGEEFALNDIVLGWGGSSRIVKLNIAVNGESTGSFMCDGMIVCTPTGSTGHSLSSGGPILHPGMQGFGINVICPHTLSSRPLVVPDNSLIEVEVARAAKNLILSIDGQDEYQMKEGARIEIGKSDHEVQFLQLPEHSYFSVLSQKLHWRGSSL